MFFLLAKWPLKRVHQKSNVIVAPKTHHPSICDSLKKNRVELSGVIPPIIPAPSCKIEQIQSQKQQSSIRGADEQMLSESSGIG